MSLADVLVTGLTYVGEIETRVDVPRYWKVRCLGTFLKRLHVSHAVS